MTATPLIESMISPDSLFGLGGKRVLIVGASGGIGSGCVACCERAGARIVATARGQANLDLLRQNFTKSDSCAVPLDLQDESTWTDVNSGPESFDGVVFASGITSIKPLRAQPEHEFKKIMHVNFEGPALLTRQLLRQKKISDGASVVYIGSIAGRIGALGHSAYSASKAALAGFARSLALELASRRIRVNTVSPGLVETEMAEKMGSSLTDAQLKAYADAYPLGLGKPQDVAGAVVYLLVPASRWVTGTDMVIDGGVSNS